MKNLKISIVALVVSFCTFIGVRAQGPIPIPNPNTPPDHYSWALPLADVMSYAKQAVRHVSSYTQAKTVLDSSVRRKIDFEFKSPRADGVVLARDLNVALATNRFDLIIAESETTFDGNINLADSQGRTLFNGEFRVTVSFDGGENIVKVIYYLSPEISIPVPSDLSHVKVSYRDAWGNERTDYFYAENGWMRIRTDLGNVGTATATFTDRSQINFSLANGQVEREERVKLKVTGEFAHTYSFSVGENMIVLGVERWMLDEHGEFTAVFEPSTKEVVLYAETPQKLVARSVRVRQLPDGVWQQPWAITPGVGLKANLYALGVWEAVFSFPINYGDGNNGVSVPSVGGGGGGSGSSPTVVTPVQP